MREIRIGHGCPNVTLGHAGENGVAQLMMDASDWESEFPGGSLALFMERADGARYNAAVERTEAGWAHILTAADLAAPGRGRIQMQWVVGEQIARSRIVGTVTLPSLDGLGDPPDEPEQGYLEQMATIGAQAQASAESAAQSAQEARETADRLSGLGAEAKTLEPGSQATVAVEDGKIVYGIPRGDQGERGPQGEPGADGVQINDAAINTADAWSSQQIVDTLCPAFEETGNPVTCYPVANYPLGVSVSWEPHQEGEGDPSPENVRPITGLDAVTVTLSGNAGTGTTATLTLPETIYGGTVDAVTGAGVATVHGVQFNGTEAWTQSMMGGNLGLSYFEYAFPDSGDLLPSSAGSIILAKKSQKISHFKIGNPYSENVDNAGWVYNTGTSTYAAARIRASRFENVEDWNAYLAAQAESGTPVTVAYKLATPAPIQATGNAPIPALPGVNTVYSDADSLTVTGRADPIHTIQALSDRVAALENAAVTNDTGGIQS